MRALYLLTAAGLLTFAACDKKNTDTSDSATTTDANPGAEVGDGAGLTVDPDSANLVTDTTLEHSYPTSTPAGTTSGSTTGTTTTGTTSGTTGTSTTSGR